MRKTLKDTAEVCHYWANKVQSEGTAGNVFFDGDYIYSYGRHFAMARHLPDGVVAISNRRYSNSTARHQSLMRQAARHLKVVRCHDPAASARENRGSAESAITDALVAALAPRIKQSTRDSHRSRAVALADQFNDYLRALPRGEWTGVKPLKMPAPDAPRLRALAADREAVRQQETVRRLEMHEADKRTVAENLEIWRQGAPRRYLANGLPVALRIAGDEVQTSHGASIPLEAAKALWPMVRRAMRCDKDIGLHHKLGVYHLSLIRADGSIVVGCHDIAYTELQAMATALHLV
jgi:hypothetical protein